MTIRTATIRRLQSRRAGEAGLTLVELLISIVLLVVVTGFLAGGVVLGRRAFVADQISSSEAETAAALDTMAAMIGAALPVPAGKDGSRLAFEGRRDQLNFVGLSAGHALPGGPLGFVIRRNSTALEVEVLPPPGVASLPQGQLTSVVLRSVADVRFSYFGSPKVDGRATWQGEWLSSDRLPALVRITVGFRDARRGSPTRVVALRQR